MKFLKTKYIIIFTILLLALAFGSIIFLKEARKSNTWPFNAKMGHYFPSEFKKFVYDISNPSNKTVESLYYNLSIKYFRIPNYESLGSGGAINQINNNTILLTLNNGQNYLFDIKNKEYYKINSKYFLENFFSIRDVELIYDDNLKYLLFLGLQKTDDDCSRLSLVKIDFSFESTKKNVVFDNYDKIWESQKKCNNPAINTSGARVIFHDNHFFITVGYYANEDVDGKSISSDGINQYSQDIDNEFGKILKVDKSGNASIFSIGHRNPQGLLYSNKKKIILSTEHGPLGGDEINIILKNKNYGWPCETYGIFYKFKTDKNIINPWPIDINNCKNKKFEQPLFSWTPSIAVSELIEYEGNEFKYFNNDILVGSLKAGSIFRIRLDKENILKNIERINIFERIRDIMVLSDGKILIYADSGNLIIISKSIKP